MKSVLEARLVDWAIRLWQNDETPIDEIGKIARVTKGEGYYVIEGPGKITVGIMPGLDPINIAAGLAFTLIGELWPQVLPNLMPAVDKQYRALIKQAQLQKFEQEEGEDDEEVVEA